MASKSASRPRAKRPNGEGGYWYSASEDRYRGQYQDAAGRLRTVSAKTESEVVRKLDKAIEARDQGVLGGLTSLTPTVGEWLDHWLAGRDDLRPRTVEKYELDIRTRIKPHIGAQRLDALKPVHVEAMYSALRARGLAPNTVHHVHAVLRAAYKEAYRLEVVPQNVMERVRAPKKSRTEIQPLTMLEAKQVLAAAADRGIAEYARWALAVRWGLRQGEALGLRWQDIDLDTGVLRVRQALQRQRGRGLVFTKPKSRAGERSFTIDADTLAALRNWRREQTQLRLRLGGWPEHDLVFTGERGVPIDPHNESGRWKRLLIKAGVRHCRIHDCRHTAATTLIEAGVHERVVMEILGHSQISLTLNTYAHVTQTALEDTAQKVAAAFGV